MMPNMQTYFIQIIAPVPSSTGFSCYIWDISARDLLVVDPTMMNSDEVRATHRHRHSLMGGLWKMENGPKE
jgi:hypothetical protein